MKGNKNMFDTNKYKYYSDGNNKVVAVSTYAGRTVRGVAKCDPRDTFDEETGRRLAAARCAVKVARKRHERAQKEYAKAVAASLRAEQKLNSMYEYMQDSYAELIGELDNLDSLSADL